MESVGTSPTSPFVSIRELCASHSSAIRLAGLAGIFLFSFWVGMSPHWDYPYPLHVDEWIHISLAQSSLDSGGLVYPNPYGSGEISYHQEMGFHLLLGYLKTASGLPWMIIYRVGPGVLLALLAFLAYAYGRRGGFGWAAALFVPLIPTSVQTLGPAFLVPVSAAMLFIPVTLLVLRTVDGKGRGLSLWVLLILIGGTLFVHPTTEGIVTALAILLLAHLALGALSQGRFREGAGLLLTSGVRLVIPLLVLVLWLPVRSREILDQSLSGGSELLTSLGTNTGFLEAFGVVAIAVAVLGLFFFTTQGEYGAQGYGVPLFTGLLLIFLLFFPRFAIGPVEIYYRGWSHLGLLLAIFVGYGIALYFRSIPGMARILKTQLRRPLAGWVMGLLWAVGIGITALVLAMGLPGNDQRTAYAGYYHVVNDSINADFSWIGDHTFSDQTVAMAEPSIGRAYPPIAGPRKSLLQAVSAPFTDPTTEKMRLMLETGEVDVPWLKRLGVSLFYACVPQTFACQEFADVRLYKVRPGIYWIP